MPHDCVNATTAEQRLWPVETMAGSATQFCNLEHLDVWNLSLGNSDLIRLSEIATNLHSLALCNCTQIGADAVCAVVENCKVGLH